MCIYASNMLSILSYAVFSVKSFRLLKAFRNAKGVSAKDRVDFFTVAMRERSLEQCGHDQDILLFDTILCHDQGGGQGLSLPRMTGMFLFWGSEWQMEQWVINAGSDWNVCLPLVFIVSGLGEKQRVWGPFCPFSQVLHSTGSVGQ